MSTSSSAGQIQWSEVEHLAPCRLSSDQDVIEGIQSLRVFSPENIEQISLLMRWCNEHHVAIVPRGGGTKLCWGNPPQSAEALLSLERFTHIIDHAHQDMTVTVQAGVTIAGLQSELAQHGQRVPLDVLWPDRATVGGVIATNESGSLRLRYGSVRDLLLGVTVVLADGTVARSGGRVVKNVAGYDLPKLFTGSFGTLGVIAEVTLRTYPLSHSSRDLSFQFLDPVAANRFLLAVSDSTLVPAALQLRTSQNDGVVVDLRFEGIEAGIDAQVAKANQLAGTASTVETPSQAWSREICFDQFEVVAKFSVLTSRLSDAITAIRSLCPEARMVAQSIGLGILGAHTRDVSALFHAMRQIGGTLVLLQAPMDIKRGIDVFGPLTSAYPVMVRVKQLFDGNGVLSPGRFVGGI